MPKIRWPFMPPAPSVDPAEIQEIKREVRENERRIQNLKRRMVLTELRLGIKHDEDDDDAD